MENITNTWYCHDCFQDFEQHESVISIAEMNSVFCKKCGNDYPREWRKTLIYQSPE
ncbi:hypothetical protein [Bacillus taeanensis]|uniref:hypothetical protein n=1 Tax=Bacillus taeanensis TaxID=273032 RepID=UPI0015EFE21B|nr:hypothetical protein [Bacillus taeanensis]